MLSAAQISHLCAPFEFNPRAEISLEVNPIQITEPFLKKLAESPVNRLSLGLQSRLDSELIFLERRHRDRDTAERIRLLRANGWNNISLDLIYGLPGSTLDDLERNLEAYLELAPEHISTYLLSLDEASSWQKNRNPQAGLVAELGEDFLADSYNLICKRLVQAGYRQYEISNFALPGYESKHNLHYWESDEYLGLGASASGFIDSIRYNNPADLEEYYCNVREAKLLPDQELAENLKMDYIIMGLRLCAGINRQKSKERLGFDLWVEKAEAIARLQKLGLLICDEEHLALSPEAYFVSNAVIGELI